MAYTNRHIRIAFDGSQIDPDATDDAGKPVEGAHYPDLGPDIWINIHNPMLMPQSMLLPDVDVPVDDNGRPLDIRAAVDASRSVMARLVASWNVYDSLDMSDDPQPLPTPATAEMFDRIPAAIGNAISSLVGRARNPR